MTTTPTPALPLHIGEIVGRRLISEDASEFWGYFEDGYQGTKKECVYIAEQMREYARAAIISDRAARVPSDAGSVLRIARDALSAAAFAHPSAADNVGIACAEAEKQIIALFAGAGSSGGSDSPADALVTALASIYIKLGMTHDRKAGVFWARETARKAIRDYDRALSASTAGAAPPTLPAPVAIIDELALVKIAYAEGKTIQFLNHGEHGEHWRDWEFRAWSPRPTWEGPASDWRVRP